MTKLKSLLVFMVQAHYVFGVYFPMTNVKLTIPKAIKNSTLRTYEKPIINLTAINSVNDKRTNLKYVLNGTGNYMQINSNTGQIFFTDKFFSQIEKIGTIQISAQVEDMANPDNDDNTILQVSVSPLKELDCDEFVEDICFWSDVTYKVERTNVASPLGSLSSPRLLDICPFKINYTLESDTFLQIIPAQQEDSWSIATNSDIRKYPKSEIIIPISCTVEPINHKKQNIRKIKKDIRILLLDVNKHLPIPQSSEFTIELTHRHFRKGEVIYDRHVIFIDDDPANANYYKPYIVGNERNFLRPICSKREFSFNKTQTAIHCKFEFKQDMVFKMSRYTFEFALNDTTFSNKNINSTVVIPIHLVFKDNAESLKKLKLYPSMPKIFRTAGPLARVTQPHTYNPNCTNFSMVEDYKGILDITKSKGIIFVHDFLKLRNVSSEYLSLNISWINNNKLETDEIQVRIVTEPNQTCGDIPNIRGWDSCSKYESMAECHRKNSCAVGTGGSASVETRKGPQRCMWRGDPTANNHTHLYSTCTPDVKTCPDGECDPLEELDPDLCPQDCTTNILLPLALNSKTGRGVDKASGTVACSISTCYSVFISNDSKKPKGGKVKKQPKNNNTPPNESLVQKQNITMGSIVSSKCDFTCMVGIGGGALFLISSAIFMVICWRIQKTRKAKRDLLDKENQEMTAPLSLPQTGNNGDDALSFNFPMTSNSSNDTTTFISSIINRFVHDPKWEFPRSQLIIEQTLGEGEFGKVLRATALNIAEKTGHTTVAVKTLKDDAREQELNDLMSEIKLLAEISHPNVIRLLGVCTSVGGPIYVIIEYAEFGSLRNYLRRTRHIQLKLTPQERKEELNTDYDEPKLSNVTPKDLLSFAWQISNGMSYLSSMKLIHRDLAARNILLTEDKVCKISDFGLSRDVYEDNAYLKRSKGRVPVKWMAPESLSDHLYTSKSDVWSFGIMVWELVTLGATPYPGISVHNLYHLLRQGYRMERPDNCSPGLYKIIRSCWQWNAEDRPTFCQLSMYFAKLLEDRMEYINLSNNAIYNRGYFVSPFEDIDEEENNLDSTPASPQISKLNYLSRVGSEEEDYNVTEKEVSEEVKNVTEIASQGYETPVKVQKVIETPTNEDPQEYTDMGGK